MQLFRFNQMEQVLFLSVRVARSGVVRDIYIYIACGSALAFELIDNSFYLSIYYYIDR